MKKFNLLFVLAFLSLITQYSCRKDEDLTTTTTHYPTPKGYVQAGVGGQVINESGSPVPNATVTFGKATTVTDENGVFFFADQTTDIDRAYIRVSHPNYLHGSRTMIPAPGSRNLVTIQLLSRTPQQHFPATSDIQVQFGKAELHIPANSIATKSGSNYNGEVYIVSKYLDPTASSTGIQMPGRLQGIGKDNVVTGLITAGMIAVELQDANGSVLKIKDGASATIKVNAPTKPSGSLPSTIPLWYFDEANGWWIEDGVATLNNGNYEGNVTHFTFWNWDWTNPEVKLKIKLIDPSGNPLPFMGLDLTLVNYWQHGSGATDADGTLCGLVPKNEPMKIKVFYSKDQSCGFYEQLIGPFMQDDSITITINSPNVQTYHITGALEDCNGNPVINGYVHFSGIGAYITNYLIDAQGNFDITLLGCQVPTGTVVGFDLGAALKSTPVTVDLTSGNQNVGSIQVCNSVPEYLNINIKGANFFLDKSDTLIQIAAYQVSDSIVIGANGKDVNFSLTVKNVTGVGSYAIESVYMYETMINGTWTSLFCDAGTMNSQCNGVLNVTQYNGIGGIMEANFNATLYEWQTNIPNALTGSFKLKLN